MKSRRLRTGWTALRDEMVSVEARLNKRIDGLSERLERVEAVVDRIESDMREVKQHLLKTDKP